jgi:hypothetical protein
MKVEKWLHSLFIYILHLLVLDNKVGGVNNVEKNNVENRNKVEQNNVEKDQSRKRDLRNIAEFV